MLKLGTSGGRVLTATAMRFRGAVFSDSASRSDIVDVRMPGEKWRSGYPMYGGVPVPIYSLPVSLEEYEVG